MSEGEPLPFWILGSGPEEPLPVDVRVKAEGLTAEKLQQLRSALAAFADDPPVTLERYELPAGTVTGGYRLPRALHSSSTSPRSSARKPPRPREPRRAARPCTGWSSTSASRANSLRAWRVR